MSRPSKAWLIAIGTVVSTLLAFYLGGVLTGVFYDHFVLPGLLKKYPHDGQIGLESFFVTINGAVISAIVVFVSGFVWTVRTSKRSNPN